MRLCVLEIQIRERQSGLVELCIKLVIVRNNNFIDLFQAMMSRQPGESEGFEFVL
ncbi:unnamed protein product [Sphenostylis stenocarpa]|uniref:Uncharacterized protein n=1 Tax=Sphenostylis stenocarpa TaxID=92480 RepID=A0AA86VLN8_9FABA|nr:unnamed protein product [Sphenostylis stenocarpa]